MITITVKHISSTDAGNGKTLEQWYANFKGSTLSGIGETKEAAIGNLIMRSTDVSTIKVEEE